MPSTLDQTRVIDSGRLGPIGSEGTLADDELITFREAAALLPRRREGRKGSMATIYRWAGPKGCKGVILWSTAVGYCRCTTRRALREFFAAVASAGQDAPAAPRSPTVRTRSAERTSRLLDEAGIR